MESNSIAVKETIEKMETMEFELDELQRILSKTIFGDDNVKNILFLICLLTYTDKNQANAIITGRSTIGKTYNIEEIMWFFDEQDILKFAGASPKSFIHRQSAIMIDARTVDSGQMVPIQLSQRPQKGDPKEKWEEWYELMRHSAYFLDYSHKIIFFPDMPDTHLLETLRAMLSHDKMGGKPIFRYEVTEKSSKGLRTKEVILKGYFTSIFCTASTELDEQEATRHFLLSPSDDPEKIDKSLQLITRKNSDPNFKEWYERDPERFGLKNRVSTVRSMEVKNIMLTEADATDLEKWFKEKSRQLNVKCQRDYPRILDLAKAWALFNWKYRVLEDGTLWCNEKDVLVAERLYEKIMECNEYGLTPEEFEVWRLIEPQINIGLKISEVHDLYYRTKKMSCSDKRLRGMLKNFCRAGLSRETKEGQTIKYYPLIQREDSDKHGVASIVDGQTRLTNGSKAKQLDKMEIVLKLFEPGLPLSIDQISQQLEGQIPQKEIPKLIQQLYDSGKIIQPKEYTYAKI